MSLDVWYPQDIQRVLVALASAGELQGPEYHKALDDVALAFGVLLVIADPPWRAVDGEARATIGTVSTSCRWDDAEG
jgi:hypothetical protein